MTSKGFLFKILFLNKLFLLHINFYNHVYSHFRRFKKKKQNSRPHHVSNCRASLSKKTKQNKTKPKTPGWTWSARGLPPLLHAPSRAAVGGTRWAAAPPNRGVVNAPQLSGHKEGGDNCE